VVHIKYDRNPCYSYYVKSISKMLLLLYTFRNFVFKCCRVFSAQEPQVSHK